MDSWLRPTLFTVLPHLGGFSGRFFTKNNSKPGSWYKELNKPPFTPPSWVIVPVWLGLYTGMGYASYLIYRDGGGWFTEKNSLPMALYGTQLALNLSWPPLFFKFHKTGLAMLDISALWGAVAACIWTFGKVNKNASYLMMPYLVWLSLASAINFWVWRHNPPAIEDLKDE